MTETLQDKVDHMTTFGGDRGISKEEVNKAIQELREEIIEEKNVTLKFFDKDSSYNRGKLDMINEVLALIGKKEIMPNPFFYTQSLDKCPKCNHFIGRYYVLTAPTETGYEPETVHLCCGCCKGSEYCNHEMSLWT